MAVYVLEIMVLVTNFGKQGWFLVVTTFICCSSVWIWGILLSRIIFIGLRLIFLVIETCKESLLRDFRHMATEDFDDLISFYHRVLENGKNTAFLENFAL